MTWHWTPIPYVGEHEGFGFGLLILNGLMYVVAVIVLLGVLSAFAQLGRAFARGWRRGGDVAPPT